MGAKTVAIAFLGLWLAFQSIEFLEQTALFEFGEQETDRAVDEAMAGFGMALLEEHQSEACDGEQLLSTSSGTAMRNVGMNVGGASNPDSSKAARPTGDTSPIYERHRKLRI